MSKKSIEERESEAAALRAEIDALHEKIKRLYSASNDIEAMIAGDIAIFKQGWDGFLEEIEDCTEFEGGKERAYIDTTIELLYTDIQQYIDSLNLVDENIIEEINNIQSQIDELESQYNSVDPSALDYVADFFGLY